MRKQVVTSLAGGLLIIGLAGCYEKFDSAVFFQNNTGRDLVLVARNVEDTRQFAIPAYARTPIGLLAENNCTSKWLIYDSARKNLVKDPGEICWHQTVSIP